MQYLWRACCRKIVMFTIHSIENCKVVWVYRQLLLAWHPLPREIKKKHFVLPCSKNLNLFCKIFFSFEAAHNFSGGKDIRQAFNFGTDTINPGMDYKRLFPTPSRLFQMQFSGENNIAQHTFYCLKIFSGMEYKRLFPTQGRLLQMQFSGENNFAQHTFNCLKLFFCILFQKDFLFSEKNLSVNMAIFKLNWFWCEKIFPPQKLRPKEAAPGIKNPQKQENICLNKHKDIW